MKYRDYTITITEEISGYGFTADVAAVSEIERPNRHGETQPYLTRQAAEQAAKAAVDRYLRSFESNC